MLLCSFPWATTSCPASKSDVGVHYATSLNPLQGALSHRFNGGQWHLRFEIQICAQRGLNVNIVVAGQLFLGAAHAVGHVRALTVHMRRTAALKTDLQAAAETFANEAAAGLHLDPSPLAAHAAAVLQALMRVIVLTRDCLFLQAKAR